jgi:hypothetical protein
MTKHSKKGVPQAKLPCKWVEDEGFEVRPELEAKGKFKALSDTSILTKSKPGLRATRSPSL